MEVSMSKTRRGKYTDNRICYISKCKGDMRRYLRRKGKLPCFSYLVRGKSFSFYRGKIRKTIRNAKLFEDYLVPEFSDTLKFFYDSFQTLLLSHNAKIGSLISRCLGADIVIRSFTIKDFLRRVTLAAVPRR